MGLHQPAQLIDDAKEALTLLKEGNRRFVDDALCGKDTYRGDRAVLDGGQRPFAVVVCCSDSRAAPEIFFDQKLGDIFVIRNAGNVVDETVLGSIEYAAAHLKCPLVVVCGHSKCGAVTAACQGHGSLPNLGGIMERIRPAADAGGEVDDVIRAHVMNMAEAVRADEVVKEEGVTVASCCYDIRTGVVTWMDEG